MLYCNTATVATTRRAGTGLGAGWAGAGRAGHARSSQAGRWGVQAADSRRGHAQEARACGHWERAGARGRRQGAEGAQPGQLGARAGLVGWSCTQLGFQPGFSTRNFS